MRPAHKALVALASGALTYNLLADDHETISEGVDELLTTHPVLTRAVIAMLALHLANAVAEKADPVHWAFMVARRRRVVVVVEPAV
ncbi:DUF7427 family protein [Mycobacterium asiaticum]|uniref:DUF7427 family protein n=1 Tax=Mycobacterium asiaticum TaxID=1790 RepID=UPI0007F044BF|nr:hypothetical protein [Mycobacterium asiaticum]OBJ50623.1 hypothetical protein A9W94_28150 [Mycobacterium asiaticum]